MMIPSPLSRHSFDDGYDIILQSRCNCGKVIIDISLLASTNLQKNAWNCHCESCRRYHTTAYTSYINVSEDQINIHQGRKDIGKFVSSCQSMKGAADDIERWYCTQCSSKLLSKDKRNDCYWVNLGPIKEDTIPKSNINRWKEQLQQIENNIHTGSSCKWLHALPDSSSVKSKLDAPPVKTKWTGACLCGKCRYEISITRLTQLQHCYCNLCRQLSGGPFMTWFPIDKRNFTWEQQSTEAVNLVRTTSFGSRHVCKHCRGVMAIVYDSQPDLIWPCAGSLDDKSLPKSIEEMGSYLNRVCHICCRDEPSWLQLPDDGMERLNDACW